MDMPIFLVEPKGNENRRCISELIARKKGKRLDLEKIRTDLKESRRYCLDKLEILSTELGKSLKRYPQLKVLRAKNAEEAINFILEISQGIKDIAVNKSATIDAELRDELVQKGFRIIDTYYEEFPPFSQRIGHYWQLPHLPYEVSEGSFEEYSHLKGLSKEGSVKNLLGLLGVSSISAEDGSIFFLQHFSNISKIFLQARKIILIAGIEKIAKDREDALFQAKCMGIFGLEGILLDLSKDKEREGNKIDSIPLGGKREENLYLILLDNGRTDLKSSKFKELLLCIGCRACIKRCPTYQFSKGEKGFSPKDHLFSSLVGKGVSFDFCLYCQSCRKECPLEIDLPRLIAEGRTKKGFSFSDRTLGDIELCGRIGGLTWPVSASLLKNPLLRRILEKGFGISRERRLHIFTTPTLKKGTKPLKAKKRVIYYAGCFARYYDPLVSKAVIGVLERNGFEVILPDQRCCGMVMLVNGDIKKALKRVRYNVESLGKTINKGCDIVVSCPTCSLSLKEEYPKLLGTELSWLVSQRTYEVNQYLVRLYEEGELNLNFRRISLSLLYHNPCHLKVQGIESETIKLLSLLPGLSLKKIEKGCCGMGGTFGLKSANYHLSLKIGGELYKEIKRAQPDGVVTECGGCRLQIEEVAGVKVMHPIILIANAYGLG